MTLPTTADAERVFARSELTPTNRAWYSADQHAACLAGATVIVAYGPVEPDRYIPLFAALCGISTSQASSVERGFNAGLRDAPFDSLMFHTDGYRRGVELGRHMRDLYGEAVLV